MESEEANDDPGALMDEFSPMDDHEPDIRLLLMLIGMIHVNPNSIY